MQEDEVEEGAAGGEGDQRAGEEEEGRRRQDPLLPGEGTLQTFPRFLYLNVADFLYFKIYVPP